MSRHRLTLANVFFLLLSFFFFTTSIQNSTDKSMKVILFTKTSVEGEGGGLGRHAVLVLVL